jgi:hypothetical protein
LGIRQGDKSRAAKPPQVRSQCELPAYVTARLPSWYLFAFVLFIYY